MRPLVVLICLLLAGCAGPAQDPDANVPTTCDGTVRESTLYLDAAWGLANATPAAASVFSNGFDEAFLTDDMAEWRSAPFARPVRLVGNVTLEYWVRNDGTPAPVVVGGQPGQGYHWFNQFGTDGGFVADYGREYASLAPAPGSVDHYVETISMPPGGLHVEAGQRLRLLLTSLVMDDDQATGQHLLVGGDTPSSLRFEHHCMAPLGWDVVQQAEQPVAIRGHQGLITGAVPATAGVNYAEVAFTLRPETQKLTISLRQSADANPLKDDMDMTVLDAQGNTVTSIGSPYPDEVGTFYAANLAAMMPPGDYVVRVDSYSGHAYAGVVAIEQAVAVMPG